MDVKRESVVEAPVAFELRAQSLMVIRGQLTETNLTKLNALFEKEAITEVRQFLRF